MDYVIIGLAVIGGFFIIGLIIGISDDSNKKLASEELIEKDLENFRRIQLIELKSVQEGLPLRRTSAIMIFLMHILSLFASVFLIFGIIFFGVIGVPEDILEEGITHQDIMLTMITFLIITLLFSQVTYMVRKRNKCIRRLEKIIHRSEHDEVS